MNTLYIVSLEPLESRYTVDWHYYIRERIQLHIEDNRLPYEVIQLDGVQLSKETTSGAFLNFFATNVWKNSQIDQIAIKFMNGLIKPGDKFLFTDGWNPGILQLRYMSDLSGIPVEIHSIWHAGSYDPQDFLGRNFSKDWSYNFERSLFFASDKNYFATNYHIDLFSSTLGIDISNKGFVCGFPFEYLWKKIPFVNDKKENIILFPHRISPEKQPEIFKDLAKELPEYKFIICQQSNLTKGEYYELLSKSKIVFSANLQETLGISMYEGYIAGAIPIVPNRLSYSEIYTLPHFYPPEWTETYESYEQNKGFLINFISEIMENYEQHYIDMDADRQLFENLEVYFTMNKMLEYLFK